MPIPREIRHSLAWALVSLVLFFPSVVSLANVTVDDQSPLITYTPAASWARINDSSTVVFDYGGGHMLTSDPAATATFNFTGIAIYVLSARWPYAVNTAVALDGGPVVLVDLVDHTRADTGGGPATVKSQVVAKAVGLKNVTHTLTVSVGTGQTFAVVDAFVYTALAPHDALPSQSTNSTPPTQLTPVPASASPSPSSTSTSKPKSKSHALAIGLSILGALILIALLILLAVCLRRRQRNRTLAAPPAGGTYPYLNRPTGGAREMRNAYAVGEEGEEDDDEKAAADLRVTNPDPSPASTTGPNIAMPAPQTAGTSASAGPRGSGALHSPGKFYGALREMTHSPTRAYPVPAPRRGQQQRQGSAYEDQEGGSADLYADSTTATSRPHTHAPTQRTTRTTVYSQVTALGLEDDGHAHDYAHEQGQGGSGMLAPPVAHGAGRQRASGRSSAQGTESGLPGEDRWAYPQAPLAYVPVFKS